MAAMVSVILFLESGFPVDIGVTVGIQQVMAQKARNIGFGNLPFFFVGKQPAAVQQMMEKGVCLLRMGHGANIVFMDKIGRQEIKKQIGPLQPQAESSMILAYGLFQRIGSHLLPGVQAEQIMSGKSRHGIVLQMCTRAIRIFMYQLRQVQFLLYTICRENYRPVIRNEKGALRS